MFRCDTCEKELKCKKSLREHRIAVHNEVVPTAKEHKFDNAQQLFKCDECGAVGLNIRWFYKHRIDAHLEQTVC